MGMLRPRHVKGTTVLDRILKAFLSNKLDDLSETDKAILERISEVDKRIRKGYIVEVPKVSVVTGEPYIDSYKRPYQKRELAEWQVSRFNISLAQAYIDIQMAEKFFLTTETRSDKEFARGMAIHWGEQAMAEAQHNGDYRAAAAFFRELNKIKGIDKPSEETVDLRDWRPIRPVIVADPSELGFEKIDNPDKLVAQLRKDLRKKSKAVERILDDAEEIDFEDMEGDDGDIGV